MTATLVQKMLVLFRALGMPLPPVLYDVELRRTYAGPHQRGQGAWSWALRSRSIPIQSCGSLWPASKLARAHFVSMYRHAHTSGVPMSYELLVEDSPCKHMQLDPALAVCQACCMVDTHNLTMMKKAKS